MQATALVCLRIKKRFSIEKLVSMMQRREDSLFIIAKVLVCVICLLTAINSVIIGTSTVKVARGKGIEEIHL